MDIYKRWQNISIKNKFLIISMLTIFCALLFVSFVMILKEIVELKSSYRKELKSISSTISTNVVSSMIFNDVSSAREILSSLKFMENIVLAALYDKEGKLFVAYKKINSNINVEQTAPSKATLIYGHDYVDFYEQIFFDKQFIGTIHIKSDLKRFYNDIKTVLFTTAMAIMAAIFISYILLIKLHMLIVKPLDKLTDLMRSITRERDYTKRVDVSSGDEIGYLSSVFNDMLDTIEKDKTELEKYQRHLEDLVAKRTAELIDKNRELKKELYERKRLEEQLIQSQKMEAIGTLAGGVAHDFNNLLTVMLGYGELIKNKIGENRLLGRYIDSIIISAEKGKRLTEGLLAFSRKQVSTPKPMNINDIITGLEKILKRLIGEDITLETIIFDEDIVVLADHGQIEQIMINLVTNARDAMQKGGVIRIKTSLMFMDDGFITEHGYGKAGYYGVIEVADTGSGIEKKYIDKIFEPFFTTKEVGKGTGLGLSVVYGIVKQNNGYINVESEVGKGTVFKVYLPVVDLKPKQNEGKSTEIPLGRGETILVAEDDESLCSLIKTVLEQYNYNVLTASDGLEAMMLFNERREDIRLIILDVIMPRMNGKEAYKKIREISPKIPTLFISGYTADFIKSRDVVLEGLDFIQKPVLPRELLRKVGDMLKD